MDGGRESLLAAAEAALAQEDLLEAARAARAALEAPGDAGTGARALLALGAAARFAADPTGGDWGLDRALARAGPDLRPFAALATAFARLRQGRLDEVRALVEPLGDAADPRLIEGAAELRRWLAACNPTAPRWRDGAGADVQLDGGLERLHADTAPRLARIAVLDRPARDAAFSADGGRLAVGTAAGAALHDASSLACRRVIQSHRLEEVALLRGGTRLVGRSDGFLTVWDADAGAFVREPPDDFGFHGRLARHPDDDLFAVASAHRISLLQASEPAAARVLSPGTGDEAAAFVDGGATLVAADWDGPLRRWRVSDGARLDDLRVPARTQRFVATADGELVVGAGREVLVFGPGGRLLRSLDVRTWHPQDIWGLAASPDGSLLVTTSLQGQAQAWDLRRGRRICALPIADAPRELEVSPDGRWLLARPGMTADRPAVLYGVRRS